MFNRNIITEDDWKGYIEQIKNGIKVSTMAIITDTALLKYAQKQLRKIKEEKKEELISAVG